MNDNLTLRTADETELDALLELWTSVFKLDAGVFLTEFRGNPPERRKTYVAESDGKLVSSVQIFGLPIGDEWNHPIMIGAVANVSTLPEFRRRGLSTRLLEVAISDMEAAGYSWSFLFTGSNSFYERLGWRTIHRSFLKVSLEGIALSEYSKQIEYRPEPDVRKLRTLAERSFLTPLAQIRTDLDWEFKIPDRLAGKAIFMSEDVYAVAREKDSEVVIEEWGMPRPTVGDFLNLLVSVASWARSKGVSNMVISAPILPEARQAIETVFPSVKNVEDVEGMVRPLSPDWPMSRLISFFSLPNARFFRLDNF